jgi:small subunit ribosomal protein S4
MGRYTGPSCKLCRREGMKLFLKGDRCYMAKCAIEVGRQSPGQHGHRRSKTSDYGVQLREKQRLRRMYGLQESQFRLFFDRAAQKKGKTGEILLQMLELRLDNIVYRLGFAASRKAARQFVNHGHVLVNGRKSAIPSRVLKAGDVVQVVDRPDSREMIKTSMDAVESRGVATWVALDKAQAKGEVLHVPTREEIQPIVNEQLIVELYSK